MALKYLEDSGYKGMIRDIPSWMLDGGHVYDAVNFIFDKPGVARQRGGTLNLVSGSQTASPTMIGFSYFNDPLSGVTMNLYGQDGAGGNTVLINQTTGAFTTVATGTSPNTDVGRPVRHFGYLIFPMGINLSSEIVAGQLVASLFSGGAACTITAGNNQITLTGADTTTNMRVGAIYQAFDPSGNTTLFSGRIAAIISSTVFQVVPTPTVTMAIGALNSFQLSAATQRLISNNIATNFLGTSYGGRCVTSFQNRLLWGGVIDNQGLSAPASQNPYDRRIAYSPLPTENVAFSGVAGFTMLGTGHNFLQQSTWPQLNYLEVPGSDPIIGMEPINDNQLLVLTSTHPVVVSGNLVTQLATTSPTITFDISEIQGNASCLSDLSIQHTAKGIVWAGVGGIYLWNGREPIDLTDKKINTFWRSLVLGSSFAIHGAAYVRNHYIVCGTSGGSNFALCVNLSSGEWTRLTNFDIFGVAPVPSNPASVYALRWWNRVGAAPSMTNGQTIKAETMFADYTVGATKVDSDGSSVTFSITSRVLVGDPETQKVYARGTIRYQQASIGQFPSVNARSGIDSAEALTVSTQLATTSSTATLVITTATNATPIVCTAASNHGLQTDDFVDIAGGAGNTHVNGRWRVNVSSATQFSLVGSSGNGAYAGSSASFKKVTESDFMMTPLSQGQGVTFTIVAAGIAINNFELHGLRVAYYEQDPVMSA